MPLGGWRRKGKYIGGGLIALTLIQITVEGFRLPMAIVYAIVLIIAIYFITVTNKGAVWIYDKKKKKWFKTLLILLTIVSSVLNSQLYASASTDTSVPVISRESIERLLEYREFKSKEELFQLLYVLYSQEGLRVARIEGKVLEFLKNKLNTLFPLDGCNLIELKNERVKFLFDNPQKVVIPNTWWQAYLLIPDELTLRIIKEEHDKHNHKDAASSGEVEEGNNPKTTSDKNISFEIEKGYIRVHFAFCFKLLTGNMRDADGSELVYQINEAQNTSQLRLTEKIQIEQKNLEVIKSLSGGEGHEYTWVDIQHPDFPNKKDVGFYKNWISFLGDEVELLPDYKFRPKGEEPRQNKNAWEFFNKLNCFKEYVETGSLSSKINYQRNLGYNFEQKRALLMMGFSSSALTN